MRQGSFDYDPSKDSRFFISECGVLCHKSGLGDEDIINPFFLKHLLVWDKGKWQQPPIRARALYELIYADLKENIKKGKPYSDLSLTYLEWNMGYRIFREIEYLAKYGFIICTGGLKGELARRYLPYNKIPAKSDVKFIDTNNQLMYKFSRTWIVDMPKFKEFLFS